MVSNWRWSRDRIEGEVHRLERWKRILCGSASGTVIIGVVSSRTDPDDDVVDVTWLSALDVVEIKSHYRRGRYRR